jgi:Leucine-rich repeat (LRR) protein
MKWNFPLVFFVAILVPGSREQQCRISGITHIDVNDCNSESYFNLFGKNDTFKIVNFNAGNKNNKFPEIGAKMFRNMTNLIELTLYNCSIESIDQNAFTNLKALETLRLADNKLTKLDENIFCKLVSLKDLNLI